MGIRLCILDHPLQLCMPASACCPQDTDSNTAGGPQASGWPFCGHPRPFPVLLWLLFQMALRLRLFADLDLVPLPFFLAFFAFLAEPPLLLRFPTTQAVRAVY